MTRSSLLIFTEVAFLTAAQLWGGPPWTVVTAVAIVLQSASGLTAAGLSRMAIAFGWLALSVITDNRELFFCFTMTLAAQAATLASVPQWRRGSLAGGLVIAAFLAFRVAQAATAPVLAVEAIVALAILTAVLLAHRLAAPTAKHNPVAGELLTTAIVVAAAAAAYAGLAL